MVNAKDDKVLRLDSRDIGLVSDCESASGGIVDAL